MIQTVEYFLKNLHLLKPGDKTPALKEKKRVKETFQENCPDYLNANRPRTSKGTKEYRKNNFTNIGNPALNFRGRFINTFSSIFENEEFGVSFGEDEDNFYSLKKYLTEEYFEGDLIKNFSEKIIQYLVDEPNGVFMVLPTLPNGEETQRQEPKLVFEPAENVFFYSSSVAFILSSEKIKLSNDEEGKPTGNVYYYFDNFKWARVEQNSKNGHDVFGNLVDEKTEFFNHNCPTMPVYLIGQGFEGLDPRTKQYYRRSLIYNAIPSLRTAQSCFLDMHTHLAFNSGGFMWAYGNAPCKSCDGNGGHRTDDGFKKCGVCNGATSSLVPQSGEFGDVIMFDLKKETIILGQDGGKAMTPNEMFGSFDGKPEIAEHYWKMYQENMEQAYLASNMESIGETDAKGSGLKKALDKEEQTKFHLYVSNLVCGLLQNILRDITYQKNYEAMFASNKIEELKNYIPFVRVPKSFDLYSKAELSELVENLNRGGYSSSILIKNSLMLAEKEFGKESINYKKEVFKSMIDPMAGIAVADRQRVIPTLTWEQAVLSLQLHNIISACEHDFSKQIVCETKIEENRVKLDCKPIINGFWKITFDEQKELVEAKAKIIASETKSNQEYIFQNQRNYRDSRLELNN